MNGYMVMCKDDLQWEEYLSKVKYSLLLSKTTTLEERPYSFILHYKSCENTPQDVFMKVTPTNQAALTLRWYCEKIWLCAESEFNLGGSNV